MPEYVNFFKMHGCGNDYIYFDMFDEDVRSKIKNPSELSIKLSNRNKGIGGDGVVLIGPSSAAHAKMRMFNADGSEAGMCGNAIRCIGKFLYENKRITEQNIDIETISGIKKLIINTTGNSVTSVKVDMGPALTNPSDIPVSLPGDIIVGREVNISGRPYEITCVSMGNPHAVIFHDDVESFDLHTIGPLFEHAQIFPNRINLEVAQMLGRNHIRMRVWERGTGETLACGTGACAVAVAAVNLGFCDSQKDILIELRGGNLTINYTPKSVYMTGECVMVFEGRVLV